MNRLLALGAITFAACFSPTFDNPTCGPNGECPSGFTCGAGNVCMQSLVDVDAPLGGDDATDAPTDAPIDGIPGVCGTELMCPPPAGNRVTICGRIWDAELDQPIAMEGADPTQPCGVATPSGPCSLRIRFYDALNYANDPMNAAPLLPGALFVDGCGRFRAQDLQNPPVGIMAVAVDDAPGIAPLTPHRLTGITLRTTSSVAYDQTRAFSTRVTTDNRWSATAGLPPPTFADRGVALFVYRYQNTPRSGVMVRRAGTINPSDDYYFTDPGSARTNVSPADNVTGPNGSALYTSPSPGLSSFDGQGNEPPGCTWKTVQAAAIPQSVLVQYIDAVDGAGAPCP